MVLRSSRLWDWRALANYPSKWKCCGYTSTASPMAWLGRTMAERASLPAEPLRMKTSVASGRRRRSAPRFVCRRSIGDAQELHKVRSEDCSKHPSEVCHPNTMGGRPGGEMGPQRVGRGYDRRHTARNSTKLLAIGTASAPKPNLEALIRLAASEPACRARCLRVRRIPPASWWSARVPSVKRLVTLFLHA